MPGWKFGPGLFHLLTCWDVAAWIGQAGEAAKFRSTQYTADLLLERSCAQRCADAATAIGAAALLCQSRVALPGLYSRRSRHPVTSSWRCFCGRCSTTEGVLIIDSCHGAQSAQFFRRLLAVSILLTESAAAASGIDDLAMYCPMATSLLFFPVPAAAASAPP